MRLPPETHRSPPEPPQRTWRVAETATYMALNAAQHPASSFTKANSPAVAGPAAPERRETRDAFIDNSCICLVCFWQGRPLVLAGPGPG